MCAVVAQFPFLWLTECALGILFSLLALPIPINTCKYILYRLWFIYFAQPCLHTCTHTHAHTHSRVVRSTFMHCRCDCRRRPPTEYPFPIDRNSVNVADWRSANKHEHIHTHTHSHTRTYSTRLPGIERERERDSERILVDSDARSNVENNANLRIIMLNNVRTRARSLYHMLIRCGARSVLLHTCGPTRFTN